MALLYQILLVIHISAAAVTLGAGTGLLRHLRRALELGNPTFQLAAEDAARRNKISGISSVILLQTGVMLIFTVGGFKAVPLNIHMALAIMLLVVAFSFLFIRPNSLALPRLAQSPTLDREAAAKVIKKLAIGQGIVHLSWLVLLILMLVRIEK